MKETSQCPTCGSHRRGDRFYQRAPDYMCRDPWHDGIGDDDCCYDCWRLNRAREEAGERTDETDDQKPYRSVKKEED